MPACVAMWWSGSDCDVDVVDEDHHDLTRVVRLGDARGTREREKFTHAHRCMCDSCLFCPFFFLFSKSTPGERWFLKRRGRDLSSKIGMLTYPEPGLRP